MWSKVPNNRLASRPKPATFCCGIPVGSHQIAPIAGLATVAATTERLRVANLVICNDYGHPVLLAKEVATLDLLSGGRF